MGNMSIIRYLIEEQGADPLQRQKVSFTSGVIYKTATQTAAQCGHINIIRYLVEERKVDVNMTGSVRIYSCTF